MHNEYLLNLFVARKQLSGYGFKRQFLVPPKTSFSPVDDDDDDDDLFHVHRSEWYDPVQFKQLVS